MLSRSSLTVRLQANAPFAGIAFAVACGSPAQPVAASSAPSPVASVARATPAPNATLDAAPPVEQEGAEPIEPIASPSRLAFTCEEVGGMTAPDGSCMGPLAPADGRFVVTYVLPPSTCAKVAEHNIRFFAETLRGVDGETDATEARLARLAADERAEWAARCAKRPLRVKAEQFECFAAATSPGEAAQCGDFIWTADGDAAR